MKYIVTVNGKKYEVEVERADKPAVSAPEEKAAPAAVQAAPAPTASSPAGGRSVPAPMPGTVSSIRVGAGQAVKKGDVLLILEAMKMENEIVADSDAVVAGIVTREGAAVNTGDILLTLR